MQGDQLDSRRFEVQEFGSLLQLKSRCERRELLLFHDACLMKAALPVLSQTRRYANCPARMPHEARVFRQPGATGVKSVPSRKVIPDRLEIMYLQARLPMRLFPSRDI